MNIRGLWSVYTNLINEAETITEEIVHTLPLLSFEISTGKKPRGGVDTISCGIPTQLFSSILHGIMWDKLFVYIRGLSELFINKKEKKKL